MRPNFVKMIKTRPDFKAFKFIAIKLQGIGVKCRLHRFPSKLHILLQIQFKENAFSYFSTKNNFAVIYVLLAEYKNAFKFMKKCIK